MWLIRKIGAEKDCNRAAKLLVRGRQLVRRPEEAKELERQVTSVSRRCTREVSNEMQRLRLEPSDFPGIEQGEKISRRERDLIAPGRLRFKPVVEDTAPGAKKEGRPQGHTKIQRGRDGKLYPYRKRGNRWLRAGPAVPG